MKYYADNFGKDPGSSIVEPNYAKLPSWLLETLKGDPDAQAELEKRNAPVKKAAHPSDVCNALKSLRFFLKKDPDALDKLNQIIGWLEVNKGDSPGHEFRGNRFTGGIGGALGKLKDAYANSMSYRDSGHPNMAKAYDAVAAILGATGMAVTGGALIGGPVGAGATLGTMGVAAAVKYAWNAISKIGEEDEAKSNQFMADNPEYFKDGKPIAKFFPSETKSDFLGKYGTASSGFHGHAGRPGQRGGSTGEDAVTATRARGSAKDGGLTEAELLARILGTDKPVPDAPKPKDYMPKIARSGRELATQRLQGMLDDYKNDPNIRDMVDRMEKSLSRESKLNLEDRLSPETVQYMRDKIAAQRGGDINSPEAQRIIAEDAKGEDKNYQFSGVRSGTPDYRIDEFDRNTGRRIEAGIKMATSNPRLQAVIDRYGMPQVAIAAVGRPDDPINNSRARSAAAWTSISEGDNGRITMFTRGGVSSESVTSNVLPNIGGKLVDGTLQGNFTHEYGHYVANQLYQSSRDEDHDMLNEFNSAAQDYIAEENANAGRPGYISHYSTSDPQEAFAETFAMIMNPGFDTLMQGPVSISSNGLRLIGIMQRITGQSK